MNQPKSCNKTDIIWYIIENDETEGDKHKITEFQNIRNRWTTTRLQF